VTIGHQGATLRGPGGIESGCGLRGVRLQSGACEFCRGALGVQSRSVEDTHDRCGFLLAV